MRGNVKGNGSMRGSNGWRQWASEKRREEGEDDGGGKVGVDNFRICVGGREGGDVICGKDNGQQGWGRGQRRSRMEGGEPNMSWYYFKSLLK